MVMVMVVVMVMVMVMAMVMVMVMVMAMVMVMVVVMVMVMVMVKAKQFARHLLNARPVSLLALRELQELYLHRGSGLLQDSLLRLLLKSVTTV
jgi:hypothetical protein